LTPASAVLDYGCGLGRHAYALSKFLSPEGAYFGHDINEEGIAFLRGAYARLANFSFHCSPLATQEDYVALAQGRERASQKSAESVDIRSLIDKPIDVQWSSSVFTHMWPEAIGNILRSLRDVMRPGGYCVNTWLMIDDFAAYVLRCGLADRALPYQVREAFTYSKENPLVCSAYREETVRRIYREANHEILEVLPGSWAGRDNGVSYQDIIISRV
jgi:SAM-dependent methyltransferase